jgi:hypothetical protein
MGVRCAGHPLAAWRAYPPSMAPKPDPKRDEPVKIDLDPEDAFRALLKVDPNAEPVDDEDESG